MQSVLGCILMAAITLPLSYLLARGFLGGVVRILNSDKRR